MRSPAYQSLTDPQRIEMIKGVLAETRKAARKSTLAEFPELGSLIARKADLLLKAGRPPLPDMPERSPFVPE